MFMIVKTVKVSDKGQISIPLDVREETGIETGDELILVQENTKILLEPTQKVRKKVKEDFSDLLKLSEKSLVNLWDNDADKIWDDFV